MAVTGSRPGGPVKKRKKARVADRAVTDTFYATKKKVAKDKRVAQRGKKSVKVSKTLRKKVQKVMDGKMLYGRRCDLVASPLMSAKGTLISTSPGIEANRQRVNALFDELKLGYLGYCFSVFDIVGQANGMFGNGPLTRQYDITTFPHGAGELPADTSQAAASTFTCRVKNSYVKLHMKNNTNRTFHITFYNCAPKKAGTPIAGAVTLANVGTASPSVIQDPIKDWADGAEDMKKLGILNSDYSSIDPHAKPTDVDQFTRNWDYESYVVIIGPGQKENFYVQGPKNLDFEWSKCWKDNALLTVQKWSRFLMYRIEAEQVSQVLAAPNTEKFGIAEYKYEDGKGKLECQAEQCYTIQMPENAGFYIGTTTAGDYQPLNGRRKVMQRRNWMDAVAQADASPITTLAENPAASATPT